MKKSTQPLSFTLLDPEQGTVEVWNRSRFLNASHYTTSWTLTADADVVASGSMPLDVAPMERKIVRIPLKHPEAVPVSSALAKDEIWAPKGHEVSWDQFELTAWNVPAKSVPATGQVRLAQDAKGITASGQGFAYRFDAATGELVSAVVDGKEMLSAPLKLNVWRAPLANELDGWNAGSGGRIDAKGYGTLGSGQVLASHYHVAGLDRMSAIPIRVEAREAGDEVVIDVRDLAVTGYDNVQLDAYISGNTYNGFDETWSWRVAGDGTFLSGPQERLPAGHLEDGCRVHVRALPDSAGLWPANGQPLGPDDGRRWRRPGVLHGPAVRLQRL